MQGRSHSPCGGHKTKTDIICPCNILRKGYNINIIQTNGDTVRIYIIEECNPSNELARYWLFDELQKALDFEEFCKTQYNYRNGYTYQVNISDPQDRR